MNWRKLYKTFLCTFVIANLSAQTQESAGDFPSQAFGLKYSFDSGAVVYDQDNKAHKLVSTLRFNIVDQIGDTTFIMIKPVTKETGSLTTQAGIINTTNTNNNELYYFLTGPKQFIRYRYSDWDVSPLTIPIKIRPKIEGTSLNPDGSPIQFIGDVAIGPYIGFEWGNKTYANQAYQNISQTIALFAAPTYVRLDPTNSSNDDSNTIFGFSFGAAYLFNLSNFQIGLTGGVDLVGGDAATTWDYQKKPWISFAIGFDINTEK